MEFKNVSVNLKNSNLLQLPLNQNPRLMTIYPNQVQNSEVTLICYKIHLLQQNKEVFVYLFKNINPTSILYEMKIREGDRLITLNEQDVTRMSYENVYSIMIDENIPFACQVIWHPELYIEFRRSNIKTIDQEEKTPIVSQRVIGVHMYEHITPILRHLLDYQPKEPRPLFEKLSRKQEVPIDHQIDSYSLAQRRLTLLSNQFTIDGNPEEIMKNIVEFNSLFEQIGIGLNKDEIYWIWLSMKVLLNEKTNIQKLSFWGKIFGMKNDYYIVEAGFDTSDEFDLDDSEFIKYQETFSTEEEDEIDNNINQKAPPDPVGNGVNQKLFFVSIGMDQPFVQLPLVTPEQIELSRVIQQFFTGDLEASVKIESAYPGVEKHLLRAQIQRISAGTQIGPKNSFKIPIHEEEIGEETIDPHPINEDINNELEDLALSDGQYWAHYVPSINQQGQNENSRQSSIHEDTTIDTFCPAWSIGLASTLIPEHTSISVRSNRWPGAFAVGNRYRFENIYIGWGVKNFIENNQANLIDIFPEKEYEFEMIEIDDPTIEEENDFFNASRLFSPEDDEEFEIDSN